jgi:glycerol-3-phosphate acyltransferase PlsY
MNPWLATLPIAYLLGSVPFGYLLVRFIRHEDIRAVGSGNIGATNVLRSGAKGLGIATLLLDCLKGTLAVLLAFQLARHAGLDREQAFDLASAAAVAATLGHTFPVWLGFRGGKGVATALGVFLVLSPRSVLVALLLFVAVVGFTRFVSLASMAAAASIPVSAGLLLSSRSPAVLAAFLGLPLLVIVKHQANIRRLLAGTENRIGAPKKVAA